jgi:CubicO group peptidase (beta-lactamase class C family)
MRYKLLICRGLVFFLQMAPLFSYCQSSSGGQSVKELTDSIRSIVTARNIPGLMVGVVKNDSVLFSGGFGYADVEKRKVVDGRSLFKMGSVSKMLVSLSILKLVQEGRLHLDDELRKVVPEVPFENKWESEQPVRVINLLEHTSGFDDMKPDNFCTTGASVCTDGEMMRRQKSSFVCRWRPGERFGYSNAGYVLLGYIVQKMSGMDYKGFITDNILRPLGMDSSNFDDWGKHSGEEVKGYATGDGKLYAVADINCLIGPAAGLQSCSHDMVKLLKMFLDSGRPLFPAQVIDEMETPRSSLAVTAGLRSGYALGNTDMPYYRNRMWRGHYGNFGAFRSVFAYNRKLHAGFVLASNGNQEDEDIEYLIADFLQRGAPGDGLDTVPLGVEAISPFLGQYKFGSPRFRISGFMDKMTNTPEVLIRGNALYLRSPSGDETRLMQTGPLLFAEEGANSPTIVFTKDREGKRVMIADGGYYEQASFLEARSEKWITLTACCICLLTFVPALFVLVAGMFGKVRRVRLLIWVLPPIAMVALGWALYNLLRAQKESYLLSRFTDMNGLTVSIFLSTLFFGIAALFYLYLVIREIRRRRSFWLGFYWTVTTFSFCYLFVLLLTNGWIGLRLWAM